MKFISHITTLIFILCICFSISNAQIAVTNFPPYDNEENLVVDVLLGNGIEASNFSSVGFFNGIGYFDGFNSNIGFDEGVILSTGGIEFVTGGFGGGSGISGDPDLELALNAINLTWGVNNVTILEFDFIAESESMAFNYVFGSSEYSSYTCTQYNDIFGFFLSGPGITGPYSNNGVNLAYIPDPNNPGLYTNTPVAVNTVNSGSPTGSGTAATCDNIDPNWQDYSIYWIDNSSMPSVSGINGFTVPFTAEYNNLICGETYHIKLAIADASDGALNSAVFLEANSFSSPEVQISTVPNAELGLVLDVDNGVLEGCGTAALQFDRSGDMTMDLTVTLEYSGEAEYGIDYAELPAELVLPAFQDQLILPIDVFFDDIEEGDETLIVTVSGVPVPCQETVVQEIELIIFDQEELFIDMSNDIVDINCVGVATIEAFVDGGYPPYNYTWYDEVGNMIESGELLEPGFLTINQSPTETTYYTLSVTDDCLDQTDSNSTDVVVSEEEVIIEMPEEIIINCVGVATIEAVINGGYAPYNYTWYDELGQVIESGELAAEGLVSIEQSPQNSTFYTLVVTDVCVNQDFSNSTDVIIDEIPFSVSLGDEVVICESDVSTVTLSAEITGLSPYTYTWFYEGVVISNEPILSNITEQGIYQLIVSDACDTLAGDEQMVTFIELQPYVELISDDVLDPTLLPEGCFESVLQFNVQEIQDQDVTIDFDVGGSADFGLDYSVTSTTVTILAGEESAFVPISIFPDNIEEGVENIEFNFPFIDSCSDFPTQITVQIYEPPPVFVDLEEELVLCEQEVDSGVLEGFVSGGIGLVNYGWYYNNSLISTDMDLETTNLEAGVYSFVAVDQCGNTSESSINFNIITLTPTVTISSSSYLDPALLSEGCGSSTLTFDLPVPSPEDQIFYYEILSPSGQFFNGSDIELLPGYVEFPAGVSSVDVEITPILDNLNEETETFVFDFLFSNDCVPQDDIVLQLPNYSFLDISVPANQILCAGQQLELEAEYSGGVPPYDVLWNYLGDDEDEDDIVLEVEEGTFPAVFTVVDSCGFSASAQVLVEGTEVDDFYVAWPPNEVFACYGDNSQIVLSLEGGVPPFTYEWFLNGQEVADMLPVMPENEIYGPIFDQGENMLFDATQLIPTTTPSTPYTYNYEVLITDSCSNQLAYEIEVNIDDCILPTAFTPNGDGNNDVLWIDFGDLSTPVSLEVFNRWGAIVYRSQDYTACADFKSECWDGHHFQRRGEKCSPGTYYYVLTYSRPINNADSRDVSRFVDGIFGTPHERNLGRQRTGSVLLMR